MSRKIAVFGATLLLAAIAGTALLVSSNNEARANDGPLLPPAVPTDAVDTAADDQQFKAFEAALVERENALTGQLALRQEAVASLDESYQAQFTALESQLEEANAQLTAASERVQVLQAQAESIQDEITAADAAFQEEMSGLQNSLAYQDTQIRQEIEAVYAQLQGAYEEISALEAQAMQSGGSHDDGDNDHDDHHEDDDDHEDHDDDYEEHDDDHDDDD